MDIFYFNNIMDNVLDSFFDTLFKKNCNCTQNECIVGPSNGPFRLPFVNAYDFKQIPELCNVITYPPKHTTTSNYTMSLDPKLTLYNHLKSGIDLYKFLEKHSILVMKNQRVYLYDGKPFIWENIQSLHPRHASKFRGQPIFKYILGFFYKTDDFLSPETQFTNAIKLLFWYFRKSIVDGILKDTIINFKLDVLAISVGSTNITSDYDITLYSQNVFHISFCIRVFHNTIYQLFFNKSADIFDTNTYGSAFIQFSTQSKHAPSSPTKISFQHIDINKKYKVPSLYSRTNCNNKTFFYITANTDFINSQHTWALIKLIYQLDTDRLSGNNNRLSAVHKTYTVSVDSLNKHPVFDSLQKRLNNNIYFKTALKMYLFLKQYKYTIPYSAIVDQLAKITNDSSELHTSFISLVNFFGHETYFTRGSFLDIVVNQQMCQSQVISLTKYAYTDSFIENTADFIHSFKDKYAKRAQLALDHLGNSQMSTKLKSILNQFKVCQTSNCKTQISQQLVNLIADTVNTFGNPPDIPVFNVIIDSINSLREIELDPHPQSNPRLFKTLRQIDETKSLQNTPATSPLNSPRRSTVSRTSIGSTPRTSIGSHRTSPFPRTSTGTSPLNSPQEDTRTDYFQ